MAILIARQRNELGIAPLLIAAIPALISAAPSIINAINHNNDAPALPECSWWQNFKRLFGAHPPCSG